MLGPVEVESEFAHDTSPADAAAAASVRHRRHKQSAERARSSHKTSAATDTSSHQQPAAGAPHENTTPQAAQFFKVGALPGNVSSGSPPLIATWLRLK